MKILIVKTSSLGDIIQSLPVLTYLKNIYPNSKIDWVVEQPFAELVKAHPLIDTTLTVNTRLWRKSFWKSSSRQEIVGFIKKLRSKKYDLVLDLQGNIKSGIITGFARAVEKRGFGASTVPEWPNLLFTNQKVNPPKGRNIRQDYLAIAGCVDPTFSFEPIQLKVTLEEKDQADAILSSSVFKTYPKYLVCPGSRWPNKKLSSETLVEFLKLIHLKTNARFLLVWGTEAEKLEVEKIVSELSHISQICPKLSLSALQHLMGRVDKVIAVDSLPLHLAGTTKTPTFSIFGPSLAAKYQPMGVGHEAYEGSCPYNVTFEKRCPKLRTCSTGACMKDVSAQTLLEDFLKNLHEVD